ncbi:MAG: FUSC family protein, partial [Candidatus Binataceae bacterium]
HVQNQLGTYLVWLLIGPVPMMSPRKALSALLTLALLLAGSFEISGLLAQAPWLMLTFLFFFTAISTYLNIALELAGFGLIIQVVVLNTFYDVIFDPGGYGWQTGALYGGCVLAFALITLFDNWLWPDPAEAILPGALAASVARNHKRFIDVTGYYLAERASRRPPEPPFTSGMPDQLAWLDRARAEGVPFHRRAILLAAISREERLHIQIDRLTVAARVDVPRESRTMFQPEAGEAVSAIADALSELGREILTTVRTGPDNPPSPEAVRAQAALARLDARIIELRPTYINRLSPAEVANFGEFTEALHAMMRLIERPLDEPPTASALAAPAAPIRTWPPDPATARYCSKAGLCIVIGYIAGITSHRPELATTLTTIVITALPTYGAAMRKMILRIIGAIIGGIIAILSIMIVSPNFSTLPSYMLAIFVVLYLSGYASLASGRTNYAGKQIATTFLLIFADLAPSVDVYGPLWRMWGIFIGTMIVTIVFFLFWPTYAGDSLLPRLRKALRDALELAPGGAASASIERINAVNTESMRVLSEILAVAEDARLEGRTSLIDHEALVQAAGTLRRIANRFATLDQVRLASPLPPLDDEAQASRGAVFGAMRTRLQSWLAFYESTQCLNRSAAMAEAARHLRAEIAQPLEQLGNQLGAGGFARIASWTLAQRRQLLAELESLRRLEFLMSELDDYLARVPGPKSAPVPSIVLHQAPQPGN